MNASATRVRIVEVGPRDGLQNEPARLSVATKVELVERLARAGLREIEAGAFVAAGRVPQMADSAQVLQALNASAIASEGLDLPVLVPNMKGYEAARAAGARHIAVFAAASETFSQKNINCSIEESLQRFAPVARQAASDGVALRGYISCVVGCPYEGAVAPARVTQVAERLRELGCQEISLGDTIGVGTPGTVLPMLEEVARRVPVGMLAGHFHDTYGMAVTNVHASYRFGLRVFDASVAGLGGCPYAPGATGNVATEDLVYLFDGMGVATGVQLPLLVQTGAWICAQIGRPNHSRAGRALAARRAPADCA
jgi:hydroxymethylglutaryl-CoA lyase